MKISLDYVAGDSVLHRLNPITKLLLALIVCINCFISQNILFVLALILLCLAGSRTAGILDVALGLLKGLLKLSVVLFLVQVFFIRTGNILLQFPAGVYITDKGVLFSLLFVLRFMGATLPLALMLTVTQMSDLSNVLVNKLHIPYKYAFSLTTAIRFIPVFAKEMTQIMEAQTARGVRFDTRNIFIKIRLIIPLCVPLLISSVKRIESNAMSAELRGFSCRQKGKSYKENHLAFRDYVTFLTLAALTFLGTGVF